MSEMEDKITALKAEIKADGEHIEKIKSEMWQKKKDLKLLKDAFDVLMGVEKNDEDCASTTILRETII